MSDDLEKMLTVTAECEVSYPGVCEGTATEHDVHPYAAALGDVDEDTAVIWYCLPCAWELARDS